MSDEWYENIKPIKEGKYVFAFSRVIMNTPEMVGAIVYGTQRLGKTMYALQVMYDIYRDWDKVLSLTFFHLDDLLESVGEQIEKREQLPALVWDDAGVHGSKYLYFTEKRLAEFLQKVFDVVGTVVKGFIITTPNPDNLLKAIRGYEFYRVKIMKNSTSKTGRFATGYKSIIDPVGKTRIRKVFKDKYDVTIPDDIYKKYVRTRESYTREAVDELNQFLKERKEKQASTS